MDAMKKEKIMKSHTNGVLLFVKIYRQLGSCSVEHREDKFYVNNVFIFA